MSQREIPMGWTLACLIKFKQSEEWPNGVMGYGWDKNTCTQNGLEFAQLSSEDLEVESATEVWHQ